MKNIFLILFLVLIVLAGYNYFLRSTSQSQSQFPTQPQPQPKLSLNSSEEVCKYTQNSPISKRSGQASVLFSPCNNYECSAIDMGASWEITYRCPGPANFPMGQIYSIKVDKETGNLDISGASN